VTEKYINFVREYCLEEEQYTEVTRFYWHNKDSQGLKLMFFIPSKIIL